MSEVKSKTTVVNHVDFEKIINYIAESTTGDYEIKRGVAEYSYRLLILSWKRQSVEDDEICKLDIVRYPDGYQIYFCASHIGDSIQIEDWAHFFFVVQ